MEAGALWQAGVGDRNPGPCGGGVPQGRWAERLAVGLGPPLRAAVPERADVHGGQERSAQGLVLRRSAYRDQSIVCEPGREGPGEPTIRLGEGGIADAVSADRPERAVEGLRARQGDGVR